MFSLDKHPDEVNSESSQDDISERSDIINDDIRSDESSSEENNAGEEEAESKIKSIKVI